MVRPVPGCISLHTPRVVHASHDWHELEQAVEVCNGDVLLRDGCGNNDGAKQSGHAYRARSTLMDSLHWELELPRVAVRRRWRKLQELRRRRKFWRRRSAAQLKVLSQERQVGAPRCWELQVMHVQDVSTRAYMLNVSSSVMVNMLVITCLVHNSEQGGHRGDAPITEVLVGTGGSRRAVHGSRSKLADETFGPFCVKAGIGRKFRCNTDGDGPLNAVCAEDTHQQCNDQHADQLRQAMAREEDGLDVYAMATLNVNGRMRLVNKVNGERGASEDWGNGRDLKTSPSPVWRKVERKLDGRSLVVLTDVGVTGKQMAAMGGRLAFTGPWKVHGTPGKFSSTMARVVAGVMILWDERRFVLESKSTLPHEEVDFAGGGLWAMGGGSKGYVALDDQRIRSDPVLRLFIRDPELESQGGWRQAQGGRHVTMSGTNKRTMFVERAENGQSQGSFESKRALLKVCLPLHDEHCFTRAAFTDGACNDTRRAGGKKRRTASFGVWEGVFDDAYMREVHEGWDRLGGNDKVAAALARGMWGGALPPDWQSIDAEMYAILAFLRRVSTESPLETLYTDNPGSSRQLFNGNCSLSINYLKLGLIICIQCF